MARTVLTSAKLTGTNLDQASLEAAEITGVEWADANGAAITVFHARNIAHQKTGGALRRVADTLDPGKYAQQITPAI